MIKPKNESKLEFIALMASLMSLVALSIDALLPALEKIGISLNIQQESNDNQLFVTMIFFRVRLWSTNIWPCF